MLDVLGTRYVTVGCAAFAVAALTWGVIFVVRGLWWTGAVPASRGLLRDARVAMRLTQLHLDSVADQADEAAARAAALPETGARIAEALADLQGEIRVLQVLIDEVPRARRELRQRLLETLVRL